MEQLEGRTAVVTGGASGIGLALGHAFAAEGMNVVLADVEAGALAAAEKEVAAGGAAVLGVVCDVSDPAAVDRLRDETVAAFGTAHVVCNNAGVAAGGQSWEVPLATWRWVLGVNLLGVVHGIRSFVPLLVAQGEGHVVNTASAAGLVATPYLGPYSATKHAVVALSEALAAELDLAAGASGQVGVSVLCPLWVRTRIHESERNAPPDVLAASPGGETRAHEAAPSDPASAMRSAIAGLVEGGMDPGAVAGQVVSAVRERRLYVLPHEEVKPAVVARAQRITGGGALLP